MSVCVHSIPCSSLLEYKDVQRMVLIPEQFVISGDTKHAHVRGCIPLPGRGGVCARQVLDHNSCQGTAGRRRLMEEEGPALEMKEGNRRECRRA